MAELAIFGLGYVGAVSAAALASLGHDVMGVDKDSSKTDLVGSGRSPVIEAGLDELMGAGVAAGRIRTTQSTADAVASADISMVCVGTPSLSNGSLDLGQVQRVCRAIGEALPARGGYHVVAIRSTMVPGSLEGVVIPALEEASGRRAGEDFGVCVNPEFLREGSSLDDFMSPPFTLIGGTDDRATSAVAALYESIGSEVITVPVRVAEMVKYASNTYHALKVAFANEIGTICKNLDVDSHQVMDVFVKDRQLNVSAAYLKPGFAFGGSCLPKDLRAITHKARTIDADVPLLEAIMPSNQRHVERALRLVQAEGRRRVGVLGFSFKAHTDDLRESPMVELIERLIGKGYEVMVYDRNVSLADLKGSNRAYIQAEIPHIASLMAESVDDVMAYGDVIIIGNSSEEFRHVPDTIGDHQTVIDLVRIAEGGSTKPGYQGICW